MTNEQKLTEVTETLKKLPQKFLESKKKTSRNAQFYQHFLKLAVPLPCKQSFKEPRLVFVSKIVFWNFFDEKVPEGSSRFLEIHGGF